MKWLGCEGVARNNGLLTLVQDATEPSNGVFSFTNGDAIANFAKANGQLIRGHNLAWYQQLPSWVNSVASSQVGSVLTTHVTTVVRKWSKMILCTGTTH
jgi:GH35 family endo-1,4-beta-xylanase